MKLAHHPMQDILFQQRQAKILVVLKEPMTSPDLARKTGGNLRHITRKLRDLEAAGKVAAVGRQQGRGRPLVWRAVP